MGEILRSKSPDTFSASSDTVRVFDLWKGVASPPLKPKPQTPGLYFHTPVALKGNPLRMVVKLVNDHVNVSPLFDADVAVH